MPNPASTKPRNTLLRSGIVDQGRHVRSKVIAAASESYTGKRPSRPATSRSRSTIRPQTSAQPTSSCSTRRSIAISTESPSVPMNSTSERSRTSFRPTTAWSRMYAFNAGAVAKSSSPRTLITTRLELTRSARKLQYVDPPRCGASPFSTSVICPPTSRMVKGSDACIVRVVNKDPGATCTSPEAFSLPRAAVSSTSTTTVRESEVSLKDSSASHVSAAARWVPSVQSRNVIQRTNRRNPKLEV